MFYYIKIQIHNNSFHIGPFQWKLNESVIKQIDDYVYVFCLDLFYILDCMYKYKKPKLGGLKINKKGKEWIKLLTIWDWIRNVNRDEFGRFPLPKNLNDTNEILNSILLLDSYDISKFNKNLMKEKEENDIIKSILIKSRLELWIKASINGQIFNQSILPFPEIAPEFLIQECKKYLKKDKCILFLKNLIENKIIEQKKLYQTLIEQIYN